MFYNKIKEICSQKGMSIRLVERQAGLGVGTIAKWNECTPTVGNLQKVARVLGVPIEYFLESAERAG